MLTVYNCRTSNAWDMDLALTTTYFPHCGLTFAILFGCPLSVEEEIIRRLSFATVEAAHPLLLPGIFAELERTRHVHVVEAMIDELETKIFEADLFKDETEQSHTSRRELRNQEKRTAFLDTAYLRNGLIGWSAQLLKMVQNSEDLEKNLFVSGDLPDTIGTKFRSCPAEPINLELQMMSIKHHERSQANALDVSDNEADSASWIATEQNESPERKKTVMRRAGRKIRDRLQAIIDEYEDKIRDCSMRLEGMAMATQWVKLLCDSLKRRS